MSSPFAAALTLSHERLAPVVTAAVPWTRWEALVAANGVTLDRPRGHPHPAFPDILYPLDYGYVNGTSSRDGDAVDAFVGSRPDLGLVGILLTRDHVRGDREVKLLLGMAPDEVYLAHGFLNFDRTRLDAVAALRYPMRELWRRATGR